MLQYALEQVSKRTNVSQVYLHVQTSNEEAVAFYLNHGFEIAETVEGYYKRIEPSSAHVLVRNLL